MSNCIKQLAILNWRHNMEPYTVCFFGHRTLRDLRRVDETLPPILEELILTKTYVEFLIGRNGEFDEYAASLIKMTQRKTDRQNSSLTLVLPYPTAKLAYYEAYYDDIVIPESLSSAHPKQAITLRNRRMVEQSKLVIVNVEHAKGGAYEAMKFAEKLNKRVVNLASLA